MYILKNWSIVCPDDNPYLAPEHRNRYLRGQVYNREGYEDGYWIRTTKIIDADNNTRIVTTKSGSKYKIEEPDPEYVKWCRENEVYVPTEECPILVHNT